MAELPDVKNTDLSKIKNSWDVPHLTPIKATTGTTPIFSPGQPKPDCPEEKPSHRPSAVFTTGSDSEEKQPQFFHKM